MTRLALLAVVGLAVVGSTSGAASQQARLRVVDASPLVVRGSAFRANEVVRVVYRAGEVTRTRTATATVAGAFVVRFPVTWALCPPASLSASGAKGSRATLKPPRTMCPQPPAEP
jgi:hypothetical protein